MYTLPNPTPKPIVVPNMAEQDGRYSEASRTKLSKLYIIHTPSGLKATPPYRGFWEFVILGLILTADDVSIAIVPISVRRYEPVVSNDIWESALPIPSVWRQAPLPASQILTVSSSDADASRVKSWEKATELTQPP